MVDRAYHPYTYDDDLIEAVRRDRRTRVRVYRLTETVVVLGSGSQADLELYLDACEADDVPILRRRGGGCAVVLDPGNVIVSVVATGIPFGRHRQHFGALTEWLIGGLERIGMPGVSQAGVCDLALGGKKVGGACLRRSRDLLYYTASLLIDPDLKNVARYLKHPPREPEYRRGRSHGDFMGSLAALALESQNDAAIDDERLARTAATITGTDTELVAARLRDILRPPVNVISPSSSVVNATA